MNNPPELVSDLATCCADTTVVISIRMLNNRFLIATDLDMDLLA
jgi:hypothetical protein